MSSVHNNESVKNNYTGSAEEDLDILTWDPISTAAQAALSNLDTMTCRVSEDLILNGFDVEDLTSFKPDPSEQSKKGEDIFKTAHPDGISSTDKPNSGTTEKPESRSVSDIAPSNQHTSKKRKIGSISANSAHEDLADRPLEKNQTDKSKTQKLPRRGRRLAANNKEAEQKKPTQTSRQLVAQQVHPPRISIARIDNFITDLPVMPASRLPIKPPISQELREEKRKSIMSKLMEDIRNAIDEKEKNQIYENAIANFLLETNIKYTLPWLKRTVTLIIETSKP